MNARPFVIAALLVVLCACPRSEESEPARATRELAAETLCAFEAHRPGRSELDVAERMHGVAAIVAGRTDLAPAEFDSFALEQAAQEVRGPSGALQPWIGAPVDGVVVTYHRETDDLLVARSSTPTGELLAAPELGGPRARELALAALDQLSAAQLVVSERYERDQPELALTRIGLQPPGEEARELIAEYTYTWLQTVRGIPFANAGLRITVDRTGALARIRIGEVVVVPEGVEGTEAPVESGLCFPAASDKAAVEARFAAEVPNSRLIESRRMYVMPDSVERAVVEPMQVMTFVRTFDNQDGPLPNISRKKFWGYSLRDANAQAVDLAPKPAGAAMPGDSKRGVE